MNSINKLILNDIRAILYLKIKENYEKRRPDERSKK